MAVWNVFMEAAAKCLPGSLEVHTSPTAKNLIPDEFPELSFSSVIPLKVFRHALTSSNIEALPLGTCSS